MRLVKKLQQALREEKVRFGTGDELDEMSRILEGCPGIRAVYEAILKDVGGTKSRLGRHGLSAERILKLGILRKRLSLTYRGLSEITLDSLSVRRFLDLAMGEVLSRSAIHGNLKAVRDSTWTLLNDCLTRYAVDSGYEDGKSLRGDTTTVETNIHYPTDASLLNDSARVLTRAMGRAQEVIGAGIEYIDHSRRTKALLYRINNTRKAEKRHKQYLELIRVVRKVVGHSEGVLEVLKKTVCGDLTQCFQLNRCQAELQSYIPLAKKVIDQAYRRIVKKEDVPAIEKIVSIFEVHSDIIVKGFRDTAFGHKIRVATGKSCMILSMEVLDGNPKDSTLVESILGDHLESFNAVPEQVAFDGCFASHANRDLLKEAGVKQVTFSKNLSMNLESLVSSKRIHRMLMRFRAGIEGSISFLKRIFSFDRVLDRSLETFKAALQLGAAACNLTVLARYNIVRANI
jgi:IS5 family transposase